MCMGKRGTDSTQIPVVSFPFSCSEIDHDMGSDASAACCPVTVKCVSVYLNTAPLYT